MTAELRVALSIDVEEEGLFGGIYAREGVSVRNVACIERLEPLLRDLDMPVTLLCTHSVFADTAACHALDNLRDRCRVEMGAHLHYWNTPPLREHYDATYRSARDVPEDLMRQKLRILFEAGRKYAGHDLTAFRMGRWDLHKAHWPMLAECGVLTEASVRPLHCGSAHNGMPDHFFAPSEPYWVETPSINILEIPLTCIPLLPALSAVFQGKKTCFLKTTVQKWGALAILPVYHPLWAMRCITRYMVARGQKVLSITWHSSEMMPGGAPHVPDAAAVRQLMDKIYAYLVWLHSHWHVRGVTLDDIRRESPSGPAVTEAAGYGGADWFP